MGGKPTKLSVLMGGVDSPGSTSILYKLKLGEVVTTIPTMGWNMEDIDYKATKLVIWDWTSPATWHMVNKYEGKHALIWVVDSSASDAGLEKAKAHLSKILEETASGVPILVFANKQDLPSAKSIAEITDKLGLPKLRNTMWYIQGCSALTGDGLYEGLDWLSNCFSKGKKKKASKKAFGTTMDLPPSRRAAGLTEVLGHVSPEAKDEATRAAGKGFGALSAARSAGGTGAGAGAGAGAGSDGSPSAPPPREERDKVVRPAVLKNNTSEDTDGPGAGRSNNNNDSSDGGGGGGGVEGFRGTDPIRELKTATTSAQLISVFQGVAAGRSATTKDGLRDAAVAARERVRDAWTTDVARAFGEALESMA